MKDYEELEEALKERIKKVCELDPYGLSPNTLYKNIYYSTGEVTKIALLFDVMPSLVRDIKRC